MMLKASSIDYNQRVRVLEASFNSREIDEDTDNKIQNSVFVQNILYEPIASIYRQCDTSREETRALGASSANYGS